ncbi:hypothetical protein KC366_g59 [Hortaea werneckii]|nr:hypothetical protein KC366_g59 [Hortaea werneckii]
MQYVHYESMHRSVHYVQRICYLRSIALRIALSMITQGFIVVETSASGRYPSLDVHARDARECTMKNAEVEARRIRRPAQSR